MKRSLRQLAHFGSYLVVRLVVCLIQAIPLETTDAWARRLAWFLWRVARLRRHVIEENLSIAYPEWTATEREATALAMWRHLVLMFAEITLAPRKLHRTNWRQHSRFPGMREIAGRLLDRRPVVIISAHLGNFEMGGYLLGLHGFPTHTIARPLDNPYLDRWINDFREATGQYILAKHGSGGEIQRVLDSCGTLVLLGDQAAGDGAMWVDFFGKPASTHKAVGLFTLGAVAPTAVCAALREGGPLHFEMRVADVLDPADPRSPAGNLADVTQWYTDRLEELIRRAPEQYWWVHRRWKGNPERARKGRRRTSAAA